MFEKRCSLCGGKLRGNICTECGLDNSKSDANYVSSGSVHHPGEGMTHTHKDNENPMAGKTVTREWISEEKKAEKARKQGANQNVRTYQSAGGSSSTYQSAGGSSSTYRSAGNASSAFPTSTYKTSTYRTSTSSSPDREKRKYSLWGKLIMVIILLSIGSSIFGTIKNSFDEWDSDNDYFWDDRTPETEADYDPYGYAGRELSDVGDTYEVELTAGVYKGGVHIPEGSYEVVFMPETGNEQNSYMELILDDSDNGIYIHEYLNVDDTTYMEDLRVYEGAMLEIEGRGTLRLHSENAQTDEMHSISNPNTQSYEVTESFEAGKDVIPGVYDVICESGSGIFDYTVEDKDGYQKYCGMLIGDRNSGFAGELKNVVLPEGVMVDIVGMKVKLIPSEMIESEDYAEFFNSY